MPRFSSSFLALILASGIALAACGGDDHHSSVPTTPATLRIMPLGDSVTEGQYVEGGYRLPLRDLLAPKLDFTFVGSLSNNSDGLDRPDHEGHSGWSILDFIGGGNHDLPSGVAQITNFVRDAKPDVILLLLGTNDVEVGVPEYTRRYRALLDDIYAVTPNVRIAFMEVTPKVDGDEPQIQQARDAAVALIPEYQKAGKRIVLIDPRAAFDPKTMLTDGVHPNALGYTTLASLFEPAVETLAK